MKNKKFVEILIGSNNKGKIREIRDLLPKKIRIYTTQHFKLKSPKETGKTFLKNSLIKAKYFSKKTGKICIADDSGLEIDILMLHHLGHKRICFTFKNNSFSCAWKAS